MHSLNKIVTKSWVALNESCRNECGGEQKLGSACRLSLFFIAANPEKRTSIFYGEGVDVLLDGHFFPIFSKG